MGFLSKNKLNVVEPAQERKKDTQSLEEQIDAKFNMRNIGLGMYGFRFRRLKFAEPILFGAQKKIFKFLDLCDITEIEKEEEEGNKIAIFSTFKKFFDGNLKAAYADLFYTGCLVFTVDKAGIIRYVRKVDCNKVNNHWEPKECLERKIFVFESDCMKIHCKSDYEMIIDILRALDNAMSASNTVIKRLGVVIFGSPEQVKDNPIVTTLDEDDKRSLEVEIAHDYGMLEEQKQIMLLRRPMRLQRMVLGGADLQIIESVELYIKFIADYLQIPYDTFAISGQSTYANQEEAALGLQDVAESFISQIWVMAKAMGINFSWQIKSAQNGKQVTV